MKYTVLKSLVPTVKTKIESYQHKFNKYNFGHIEFQISDPYVINIDNKKTIQVVDIDVTGEYKISGWVFVASLEWVPEAGTNLVMRVDSTLEIPKRYLMSTDCEHCHSNRDRKYTIVIYNEKNKEFKQVGRQCVKDYIGADVEDYLSYLSLFTSMTQWFNSLPKDSYGKEDSAFKVDDILAQTFEEVNHFGYVSQQTITNWYDRNGYDCDICPLEKTSSQVYKIMNKVTGYASYELVRPAYEITNETWDNVKNIKHFVEELVDNSDYIHNLKTIFKSEFVDNSKLGIVVSAVGYYLRETAARVEAEKESTSEYIGDVGNKIEFTANPVVVSSSQNEYGVSFLYKFIDNGNVIMWRTGKYLDPEIKYTIKATIKEHSDFRNVKQTVVTRGKILYE